MKFVSPRMIVGNRGDLLSRFGILEALQRRCAAEWTVFTHRPEDLGPLECSTLPYGPLFNFWPRLRGLIALRRATAVVWTGGLDLQDDSSLLKLLHTWLTFLSYRLLGKRIYAVMQGAGPIRSRVGRWLTRRIVKLTDVFLARDTGTRDLLTQLDVGNRVVLCRDGIFLSGLDRLQAEPHERAGVDRIVACPADQPIIGVNIRLWFHFHGGVLPYAFTKHSHAKRARAPMDHLIASTIELVRRLREQQQARIVLISMYEPGTHPWEDDLPHLERVKAAFAQDEDVILLREPLSLGGFCEMMSRLDLMIGSRLHSTLTALRFGVPAINLAYTNKCRDILGDLGLHEQIVDLESFMQRPDSVVSKVASVLADDSYRAHLQKLTRARIQENELTLERLFAQPDRVVSRRDAA